MVNLRIFFMTMLVLTGSVHAIAQTSAKAKVTVAALNDSDVMEKARGLFARGEFKKAIELYSKIPASSDFWLEALEERAWSETRLGNYENALADLQSITSAIFSSQVGPETYMLSTFVSLKICAYKDVVKKIDTFKKRILPRVDALQEILDKPVPEAFWALSNSIKKSEVSMNSLGAQAEKYPRYFFRDKQLIEEIKGGNRSKVQARLRTLAQLDLDEIELNLKKMKIIDVEVIQKVLLADDKKAAKGDLNFASVNRNQQMIFPVTDDEVWVDEVGHFQVKADKCPYSSKSVSAKANANGPSTQGAL